MRPVILLSLFGSWYASAGEITVLFMMIASLIGVIVFSYFFYNKKHRENHIKLMKLKYDKYILKLELTDEELQLVTKMTKFLESDEKRYLMLTDKRTFSHCASELRKNKKISKVLQDSVERKLNFPSKKLSNNYFSSEDLPPGMPALVILEEGKKVAASILENTRAVLTLKLKNQIMPLRISMPISVYFHDNQKIFIINTTVLEHKEEILTVSHSLLTTQKRRSFIRKKIKLPILLKHSDFEEIPMHSYIIDLSEGGASLENPDFNFKKNDRVNLYYHIDTEDGFQIHGEVLRLSAKGRIIHIKFLERDLTIRSRIKTIVK